MQQLIEFWRNEIKSTAQQLAEIQEPRTELTPAPGEWCAKEIVGHLIDSATNNHCRFVQAQFKGNLIFSGYDQERWVAAQNYRHSPWPELVGLWKAYNLHLLRVIAAIPPDILNHPHNQHNLNQIAWRQPEQNSPVSLEYLIRDYYGHLKHHINTVFSITA